MLARAARASAACRTAPQRVRDSAGVRYIDDSKGTNVGATVAAIAGLDGPLVLIAGGEGKGQDFAPLARGVPRQGAQAVLIGRDARLIEAALAASAPPRAPASMEEAVQRRGARRAAGRHRAAVAGLRELRHVPRLRRIAATCSPPRCGSCRMSAAAACYSRSHGRHARARSTRDRRADRRLLLRPRHGHVGVHLDRGAARPAMRFSTSSASSSCACVGCIARRRRCSACRTESWRRCAWPC